MDVLQFRQMAEKLKTFQEYQEEAARIGETLIRWGNQLAVRTYEEIRSEIMLKAWGQKITMKAVEEMAAKEYAKQWIERAAQKANTEMIKGGVKWIDATSIRNIKKEIDAHG